MSKRYYLGADVGGSSVKLVLVDGTGDVVTGLAVTTDPGDPGATLAAVATAVEAKLTREKDATLQAVGLACAGIIDTTAGMLGRSPNLPGWQDTDLGRLAGDLFGAVPVALANDVNAALYGEYRSGAGRGCENLVMMALGTGVGGGVVLHGRLITGVHHAAGEIGHTVLDPLGPPCACGNRGCLEAWAGSTALLRRARALAAGEEDLVPDGLGPDPDPGLDQKPLADLLGARGQQTTTSDLSALAEAGDPLCRALFAEAGRRLGQATANLVNVLDPDRVIIGGGVAACGDLMLAPCREAVPGLVLGEEAKRVPIVLAELGSQAAAVGAAWLARERVSES